MASSIRISAEVQQHDRAACKFVVDRPVLPGGFARFASAAQAQGSPLAERLFAIRGISAVLLHDQEVLVWHTSPVDWRAVGPQIGAAIRSHLESGRPAASEVALNNTSAEDRLRMKVQRILEEQINPAVASHGGVISLLDVRDKTVFLKMGGGCQGCGMANVTLREGVENALREQIPEIGEILDVTDHAEGRNPYYAAH
jgi:Fe-S cluster biogenesis protein NfuA